MKICKTCGERYPDDANFCPMDASKLEPVAAPAPAAPAAAATAAIGGRFTPGERLGGTSTGEVFAATDAKGGGTVALKLCHPAIFPSPIAMERTQRELRQLQRTSHPAIATIIDHGRLPDGRLYVAAERCEGLPLSAVIAAEGPMPFSRARGIVCTVGDALVEAQKGGVIHRDVAPKNVLLGAGDRVKVINFGVAPRVNDRVFGVPEFLSPEQAEGKPADQRSNIYSLGALLYFLLTGRSVHFGEAEAVLAAQLSAEIAPLAQVRPELAGEVDRIVTKALERNPSRRQLTLRQFLTELAALPAQPVPVAQVATAFDTTQRDMNVPSGMAQMATLPASSAALSGLGGPPAAAPGAPPPAQVFPQGLAPIAPPPAAPVAYAPTAVPPAPGQPLPPTVGVPVPVPAPVPAPSAVPVPVQPAPAAAPVAPAAAPAASSGAAPGAKGGFRETLWFKKGEVEEYIKQGQAGQPAEAPAEDERPIEDRYVDDGSVTAADRAKFSLRTGGTQVMQAVAVPSAGAVPGERVSEKELFDEYAGKKGSGAKAALIIVAIILVIGLAVGLTFYFGSSKDDSKEKQQPAAEVTDRPFRGGAIG